MSKRNGHVEINGRTLTRGEMFDEVEGLLARSAISPREVPVVIALTELPGEPTNHREGELLTRARKFRDNSYGVGVPIGERTRTYRKDNPYAGRLPDVEQQRDEAAAEIARQQAAKQNQPVGPHFIVTPSAALIAAEQEFAMASTAVHELKGAALRWEIEHDG